MRKKQERKRAVTVLLTLSLFILALTGCAEKKDKNPEEELVVLDEIDDYADNASGSVRPLPDEGADSMTDPPDTDAANETEKPADSQAEDTSDPQTEAADTGSLYERFLDDALQATVSDSYPVNDYSDPIVQRGASYTLSELGQCVSAYFLNPEYTDRTSYDKIQYAYTACPDSSSADDKYLLVKFIGLNIYSMDDDSYAVFVLAEENGQLYVTDHYECWARSETTVYDNGTMSDYGSSGAGDHYIGVSALLSKGLITSVSGTEELYGWWASSVAETIYNEVFGTDTEPGGLVIAVHTIGDNKYYQYDLIECTEEQKVLCEEYIDRCREEQGINWATDEEVQTAVRDRCIALGLDDNLLSQQTEPVWNDLQ